MSIANDEEISPQERLRNSSDRLKVVMASRNKALASLRAARQRLEDKLPEEAKAINGDDTQRLVAVNDRLKAAVGR
jgi:hypothetical protein